MNRLVKKDSAAASQKKKNDRIHEGIYQINTEPCDDDLQSTSSAHNDTAATKADDVGNDEGKTNNDNDSFYDDWVLYGNNNNINSNSNNDDDDHKRQHKSQIATQSRSATKKDKENSKGDGPTNRKRTRDQSDDEESCDDTDDSNIDHEDDEDEDECLPENNTNFCSNQNNDSKSPVVGGKRGIKWMKFFQRLVAYKKVHNNTMVPSRYDQDPSLGRWVRRQRENHRNDNMISNRLALLNSIDFEWDGVQIIRKVDDTKWMKMFQRLNDNDDEEEEEDPRKDNNDVHNHQEDNRRSRKNDEIWMGMYEKLVAYKNQHKNTMVPQRYEKDPKLGSWIGRQRQVYRDDKLLPKRLVLLTTIDFTWNVNKAAR